MATVTDGLLANLADRVGAHYSARAVFGEAVERDRVTVIPVARGRFGFGGGSGGAGDQSGDGGGGGAIMSATGYIEIKDGKTRFVPIVDPTRIALLVLLGAWALRRAR